MRGIVLGAASFFIVFWVDVAALKRMSFVKPVLWLASVVLFVWGLVICMGDPSAVALPTAVRTAAAIAAVLFSLLLVYSLFIEIPFAAAYLRAGKPSAVVATGTYALCRHPGVLWLTGLLAALFFSGGSRLLLLAMPIWLGLDTLYVILQDRLFFPRMFGADYEAYQREVPMLVPNARSVRRCAQTIFRRVTK
jgi:protein-S-isoprenylcysteine O-methyltransferase Ste14